MKIIQVNKKKDLEEAIIINNINTATEAIQDAVIFLSSKLSFRDSKLYSNISSGLYSGIIDSIDSEIYDDVSKTAKKIISKICKSLKERVGDFK